VRAWFANITHSVVDTHHHPAGVLTHYVPCPGIRRPVHEITSRARRRPVVFRTGQRVHRADPQRPAVVNYLHGSRNRRPGDNHGQAADGVLWFNTNQNVHKRRDQADHHVRSRHDLTDSNISNPQGVA